MKTNRIYINETIIIIIITDIHEAKCVYYATLYIHSAWHYVYDIHVHT